MSDELEAILTIIEREKTVFSEDEREIIDSWIEKLRETGENEEELQNAIQYGNALAKFIMEKRTLFYPFSGTPPIKLPPFEPAERKKEPSKVSPSKDVFRTPPRKFSFEVPKLPCKRPNSQQKSVSKPIKKTVQPPPDPVNYNEYEDADEMASAITRSKGQTLSEFVASISRHTKDFGHELRAAMKTETSSFRDYVDHVLSQRIKDLTEVLDEEQNRELLRIKKDTEKWQLELSHVKRRIKELVPTFDIDLYRKDKNYLKKQFTVDTPGMSPDDSFQRWKEESVHRLKWITEMTNNLSYCNERITQEISDLKNESLALEASEATKQQNLIKLIDSQMSEYQRLKQERDRLHKENAELLSQLQEIGR